VAKLHANIQIVHDLHKNMTICAEAKLGLGLGTHLFVKVLRPGDSEGTFSAIESSCHLLLPV